jgi:FkbM family methyltransferase
MPQSLVELLQEPLESVMRRERCALDDLLHSRDNRVVLFGSGNLGTRAAAALRSIAIEPLAFSDNNQARWGTQVEGLEVLPPVEAAAKFGRDSTFLVTIWNAFHWFNETAQQLDDAGCDQVAPYVLLHWRFPETFLPCLLNDLPHNLYRDRDLVLAAANLWADRESRSIYEANMQLRALGVLDNLPGRPIENTYFPSDLLTLNENDLLLDCGAFDGDTARQALSKTGSKLGAIHAVEADTVSYGRLQEFTESLPADVKHRIHLYPCAVGAKRGSMHLDCTGTVHSGPSDLGSLVEVVAIDELFANTPLTLIKMDIEGAEYDALRGAAMVIQRDRPILAICVYHTQNDIWRIPLLVRKMLPEHKLYLRAYEGDGFQTVLYAVPPERVPRNA